MAKMYQLDFLQPDEMSRLEAEIQDTKARGDRVRKGMYARLNKLQKMYDELYEEHQLFKRAICRGEYENNLW